MRYFKAFHPGMICNGKQYAENTTYEEQGADECCKAGVMHFCETPFDCLDYYDLVEKNGKIIEFAEVEPLDKILANGNKRATKKLHIGAKLSLKDIINAQVEIQMEKCTPDAIASGYGSKLAASGYGSQLAASGKDSIVAAIGVNNVASASLGSWIVLAEYGNGGKPICVKAAQVDGETLKANVFYRLKGGEFVEV